MRLKENIKFREEFFGGLLFNRNTRKICSVNKTGALIIKMIKKGKTRMEIFNFLKKKFRLNKTDLKDIENFLIKLEKNNIV